MKIKTTALVILSFFVMHFISQEARAESRDKEIIIEAKEELEKQHNDNLINKIETAQKEQVLKYIQKKHEKITI